MSHPPPEEIARALEFVASADDRPIWIEMGMALKDEFGDSGKPIWDTWSSKSAKYSAAVQDLQWKSFGRRQGITIASLIKRAKDGGYKPPKPRIVAEYPYTDEDWVELFQAVRFEPKDFRQRRKGPDGKWIWNLMGVRLVPFHLPQLIAAVAAGKLVCVVEGEKDVLSLEAIGITATCNPMGGGKWWREFNDFFKGAAVAILTDNDKQGTDHGLIVGRNLHGVAKEVRTILLPDLPDKGDVSDWLAKRKGIDPVDLRKELAELIKAAPIFDPATAAKPDPNPNLNGHSHLENDGGIWGSRKTEGAAEIVTEKAGEIVEVEIDWLWPPYFARGKLHMVDGDPGEGKSTLTIGLAAHISTGIPFPNDTRCEPGDVVICSAEDGVADTIIPRLRVASADKERISILHYTMKSVDGSVEVLTLPRDIPKIEKHLIEVKATALILDPYSAFIGDQTDTHNDSSARRVLSALSEMAARTNVAIIMVRHLNKMGSVDKALYRGGGSIAIGGACRAVYLIAEHPDDKTLPPESRRRVMACVKTNLAPKPPSLMFRMMDTDGIVRLEWIKEACTLSADDLLRGSKRDAEALENAIDFLSTELKDGPRPKKMLMTHAKEKNISDGTLRRAFGKLKLVSDKEKGQFAGGWFWKLPEE